MNVHPGKEVNKIMKAVLAKQLLSQKYPSLPLPKWRGIA